jgi:hypothetical protein
MSERCPMSVTLSLPPGGDYILRVEKHACFPQKVSVTANRFNETYVGSGDEDELIGAPISYAGGYTTIEAWHREPRGGGWSEWLPSRLRVLSGGPKTYAVGVEDSDGDAVDFNDVVVTIQKMF